MEAQPARQKFHTTQEWNNYLNANPQTTGTQLHNLRLSCYADIEALRKRPLLVYYTKFIDSSQSLSGNTIDLTDIDGFTDLCNSIKFKEGDKKEIDILIHSPGGRADATERIVNILRNKFDVVHFLVPHSAYSAATMLALSGDSITLHPSATLGPIDPQFNGTPVRSIKRGFNKLRDKIKEEGPEALPAYIPLLDKYTLDLLEQCDDAEMLSKDLVAEWLKLYMFKAKTNCEEKIKKAVAFFSSYDDHHTHSRPLFFTKLKEYDLDIQLASGDLEDLLWEAHIVLNGFVNASQFVKLYENNRGISWGRQNIQLNIGNILRPQLPQRPQIPPPQPQQPQKSQITPN